jgi:acetyl-CoA carboxylase biotin carboxyl carrier protein
MESRDLQNLIKFISKSEVAEVKYKTKDFEIVVKNVPDQVAHSYAPAPSYQAPAAAPAASPVAAPAANNNAAAPAADDSKYITIKSPMIGTFYRKASPDKPSLTDVGATVAVGDMVCIIEAMKLFNQIESEVSGKIVKVLVEDAQPVEYDQPLFLVEPN